MTRQRKTQLEWKAKGRCGYCPEHPETLNGRKCDACKDRERSRKGYQPWQPGKRGRPPIGTPPVLVKERLIRLATERVVKARARLTQAAEELHRLQLQAQG